MTQHPPPDVELDVSGLECPLPVLKLRKRLMAMSPGSVVRMTATDPAARIDVPHFCSEAGHELLAESVDGETLRFVVRKGTAPAPGASESLSD